MEGIFGFLKGFSSLIMALVVIIALIGAIVSADIVYKVCGIAGLIIWLVICVRSLNAHTFDGKSHDNKL